MLNIVLFGSISFDEKALVCDDVVRHGGASLLLFDQLEQRIVRLDDVSRMRCRPIKKLSRGIVRA